MSERGRNGIVRGIACALVEQFLAPKEAILG